MNYIKELNTDKLEAILQGEVRRKRLPKGMALGNIKVNQMDRHGKEFACAVPFFNQGGDLPQHKFQIEVWEDDMGGWKTNICLMSSRWNVYEMRTLSALLIIMAEVETALFNKLNNEGEY